MTAEEQLEKWLKGISVHNEDRQECCPDFSCCSPELLASVEERIDFVNAHHAKNQTKKDDMLAMFLGRMLKGVASIPVYVSHERKIKK